MNTPKRIYPVQRRSFYFKLVAHNTLTELRYAWDDLLKSEKPHSSRGVQAFTLKFFRAEGKCLGEIHVTHKTPLDVLSHECCHAALHYIDYKQIPIDADFEENYCYTQQYMFRSLLKGLGLV